MVRAALVGVALAGCSAGTQASETLPSASTSAAATSRTLEPLGPPDLPMPDEAREQTPEGAEAFLKYYMAIYTKAQAEMDPTYLRKFSQDCAFCDALTQRLHDYATSGYLYDGGAVTLTGTSLMSNADQQIEGAFTIDQEVLTIRDPNGTVVSQEDRAAYNCGAILSWSPNETSWVFTQWDVN
jgi:hypothetical protein